jgi:hypothetical protein
MPPSKPKKGVVALLVSLLLLYGLYPLIRAAVPGGVFINLFLSVMFFAGVYSAGARKRGMVVMLFLGGPALILTWAFHLRPSVALGAIGVGFAMAFVAYMIFLLLNTIRRAQTVTSDVVFGAASVYLLIGLFWAFAYILIVAFVPGAFHAPHVERLVQEGTLQMSGISVFLYYSIVTLTTLGYGDIVPVAPIAQTLSSLEAIIGQLYLAILLGRVVGLHVAHSTAGTGPGYPSDVSDEEECTQ